MNRHIHRIFPGWPDIPVADPVIGVDCDTFMPYEHVVHHDHERRRILDGLKHGFPGELWYRSVENRPVTADDPGISGFADLDHIKIAIRDALEVNQDADGPFEFRSLEDRHMEGNRVSPLN